MIIEEKLFDTYELEPLFVVGCEGFFGLTYFSILLPIFQRIPCHLDGVCGDQGVIEDSMLAFRRMKDHPQLLLLSIGFALVIAGYNTTGQALTKHASAAQRVIVDNCNTLLIWTINLAVGTEKFIWPQLIGYLLLLLGALVYNEILVIPVEIMRKNTELEIQKREQAALVQNVGADQKGKKPLDTQHALQTEATAQMGSTDETSGDNQNDDSPLLVGKRKMKAQ